MLRLYYDRNEKQNFERLFGGLWIGAHPTPNRNRYLMLKLDFSEVGKGAVGQSLDQAFDDYLSVRLDSIAETYPEAETLQIYRDFKGVGEFQDGEPEEIVRSIKPWYDGYCFAKAKIGKESVFNSDMVLYHLKALVAEGIPPENMVDVNISTDYDKLETIVELQRQAGAQNVLPGVNDLVEGVPSPSKSISRLESVGDVSSHSRTSLSVPMMAI